MFPYNKTVRLDGESVGEIEKIAMFERTHPTTWMRQVIIEKVRTYERNPQYKRFKKDLEAHKK